MSVCDLVESTHKSSIKTKRECKEQSNRILETFFQKPEYIERFGFSFLEKIGEYVCRSNYAAFLERTIDKISSTPQYAELRESLLPKLKLAQSQIDQDNLCKGCFFRYHKTYSQ